ncbi:MAG: biotin--[acetyl-CoA-carboxylase] ligase [Actinomycetota bacterium]
MRDESERDRSAFLADVADRTRFEQIGWIPETGSTNDDLAAVAADAGPEQVLVTDLQTAGRGRRDRVWTAPSESAVLMSFLIRDGRDLAPFWTIGCVALAAAEAVSERTTPRCRLKWPNDLLIEGRKVAGVLAQLHGDTMVVGIGINANWRAGRPEGVPDHATSIDAHLPETGASLDRLQFVGDLVTRVDSLLTADSADVRSRWVEACETVGAHVRAELDQTSAITGMAIDVDVHGGLQIQAGTQVQTVHVGDVVHLRRD